MKTKAVQVVGAASVVALVASGCGDRGGEAEAGEPTATSTATASAASGNEKPTSTLVLEAGQSDQELAFDFVDSLNEWFQSGQQELEERLPEDASPELIAQTAMEIAQENSPRFSEALLVEDFDTRSPDTGDYYTTEAFEWWNASVINQTIDGHKDFHLNAQGDVEISPYAEAHDGYKLTLSVAQPVTSRPDDIMWIKVHRITDPSQEHVPVDIKQIVPQFEMDGDHERLASMMWG